MLFAFEESAWRYSYVCNQRVVKMEYNLDWQHFCYCQPSNLWLVHSSLAARVSGFLLSVHFLYQLILFIPHNEHIPFCVCVMNLLLQKHVTSETEGRY